MSENYLGSDGYKPMVLPDKGEELLEGRQYVLTPLARAILKEVYCLVNIPTIVLCVRRKVAPTIIFTLRINLETKQRSRSRMELPAQEALFKVQGTKISFELDLAKMEEFEQFYNASHKLPGCDEKQTAEQIRKMEEDWFLSSGEFPINRKLRGCTLRWWSKGEVEDEGGFKPYMRKKRVLAKAIDLSIFD